ncbi:YppG family protein [Halalkalibacter alkalisediminis]|uniref:YppG family protein n=1 Tax=Halalkalibacter alkalisediminis TaxID=935616 RepID=A0ABV6NI61_9BACI|nr:YppG family protein [Halalkalibacter alkalisediminis]
MFQPNPHRPMNLHYPYHQGPFYKQQYPQHPMQMNGYMPKQQNTPFSPPNMGMNQSQPPGYTPSKASFFKAAFTNESGNFDMGKTVNTVDQVMKTVNQVSPLVKQVSSFFIKK